MSNQKQSSVAVLMGSDSDLPTMESCIKQLKDFGIDPIVRVLSAHRTPAVACEFAANAAMAAHSQLPIIGVPMQAKEGPCGLDALLSTVQMPPGMPVGTMAIGKAGAKNAAVFALQILALSDAAMAKALTDFRTAQTEKVLKKDAELNA
ncbi:MAG: 5-(carboxyamino)imidazole ribonucleotide mutase [Planctomycetota bacterium]|jgi:phosphoribosylcarboxyaminoimidazole (NCAIR) mutase